MPCATCSRHILTVFMREAAGIILPKTPSPLRLAIHSSRNSRSFSTGSSHAIQNSGVRRSNLSVSSNVYMADDTYIPFDHPSVAHANTIDSTEIPLISPPPPPPEPHQDSLWTERAWLTRHSISGFEPELELQDGVGNGSQRTEETTLSGVEDGVVPGAALNARHVKGVLRVGFEGARLPRGDKAEQSWRRRQEKNSKNSARKSSRYGDVKEAEPRIQGSSVTTTTKPQESMEWKSAQPRPPKKNLIRAAKPSKSITPARRTHQQRLQKWREQRQLELQPHGSTSASGLEELQERPLLEDLELSAPTDLPTTLKSDKARQIKIVKGLRVDPKSGSLENSSTTPLDRTNHPKEDWQVQKAALSSKFGEVGWTPRKKLSPDALEGIRALRAQYPSQFTTPVLADSFKVSPEAIRRILKSKWQPNTAEEEGRRARWEKRGERIWAKLAEENVHPPKRWRDVGIGAGGPRRGRPEWLAKIRKRDEEEGGRPKIARRGPGRDHPTESLARRIL